MNIPFAVSDISWITIYELQRTGDLVNLGKENGKPRVFANKLENN